MTRSALAWAAVGGLLGVAWAASLRGFMVGIAGDDSTFDWYGTFVAILLPGLVCGVLIGWVAKRRADGDTTGGWVYWSLLLLAIAPMTMPGALAALVTTGIGGGAVAVALIGLLGGYALSGRGPIAARIAAAVIPVAMPFLFLLAPLFVPELALTTPRGAWTAILFLALMALLGLAAAIPLRRPRISVRPVDFAGARSSPS